MGCELAACREVIPASQLPGCQSPATYGQTPNPEPPGDEVPENGYAPDIAPMVFRSDPPPAHTPNPEPAGPGVPQDGFALTEAQLARQVPSW